MTCLALSTALVDFLLVCPLIIRIIHNEEVPKLLAPFSNDQDLVSALVGNVICTRSNPTRGNPTIPLQRTCTIVLKETLFTDDGDPERPYFKVNEKEELVPYDDRMRALISGGTLESYTTRWMIFLSCILPLSWPRYQTEPRYQTTHSLLLQDVASKYSNVTVRCVGSFINLRNVFEWSGIILVCSDGWCMELALSYGIHWNVY